MAADLVSEVSVGEEVRGTHGEGCAANGIGVACGLAAMGCFGEVGCAVVVLTGSDKEEPAKGGQLGRKEWSAMRAVAHGSEKRVCCAMELAVEII